MENDVFLDKIYIYLFEKLLMTTIQEAKVKTFKPFIKRVWWKRQLLSQLEKFYPKKFNNYFEPFVGWWAMFFDLRNKFWTWFPAYLIDINDEMIITYNTIKNNVEWLIKELKTYRYDKEFFMKVRAWDREPGFTKRPDVQRAARFIYLNRTGFNWLYRVNGSGFYNVPMGSYSNPMICDVDNLFAVQASLENTTIKNEDFENILKYAKKWDFVYLDPPYDPLTETANFTSYNKWWFGKDEQVRLFEVYKKLDKLWCYVMLSNHNTDFINDMYMGAWFRKETVMATRAINSNSEKRGKIEETVILNY